MTTAWMQSPLWLLLAGVLLTLAVASLAIAWKSRDSLSPWSVAGLAVLGTALLAGILPVATVAGAAFLVYTSRWQYFDVRRRSIHRAVLAVAGLAIAGAFAGIFVLSGLAIGGSLLVTTGGLWLLRLAAHSDSQSSRGLWTGWWLWLAGTLAWAGSALTAGNMPTTLAAVAFTFAGAACFGSLFERGALKKDLQRTVAELEEANTSGFERENELKQTNAALTLSQRELEAARRTLEQKNREAHRALEESARIGDALRHVSESIAYARRIQEGLLAGQMDVNAALPESLFYNRPRDVVSGDFCWLAQPAPGEILLAVADCTGHGVPGAFMTVLADSLLRRVADAGEREPHCILEEVDRLLRTALAREAGRSIEDGMDIGLCHIWPGSLNFAGARHALVQVREGAATIHEGDRRSIGGNLRRGKRTAFRTQRVQVRPGDRFYLFSDGFMDQLGGSEGRKYMRKRFYDILPWLAGLSFAEQERALDQIYEKWRGEYEPTDDRLILGFELPRKNQ